MAFCVILCACSRRRRNIFDLLLFLRICKMIVYSGKCLIHATSWFACVNFNIYIYSWFYCSYKHTLTRQLYGRKKWQQIFISFTGRSVTPTRNALTTFICWNDEQLIWMMCQRSIAIRIQRNVFYSPGIDDDFCCWFFLRRHHHHHYSMYCYTTFVLILTHFILFDYDHNSQFHSFFGWC